MNRHERRRAHAMGAVEYAKDPAAQESYSRGAETHYNFFRWFLRLHASDPPRFALLPPELGLIGALDEHELGHRLARNDSAHELIDSFLDLAKRVGIEPPTYMMLRTFIDLEKGFPGLETESVSIGESRHIQRVELNAVAGLLIKKGVCTEEEWQRALDEEIGVYEKAVAKEWPEVRPEPDGRSMTVDVQGALKRCREEEWPP